MFRVEYLKLEDHPQLGNLELFLSEKNEINNILKPYSSVIIGPNGTGKSYILRAIAEIFRQLKMSQINENQSNKLSFDFVLKYYHNKDHYWVHQKRIPEKRNKILEIFKNVDRLKNLEKGENYVGELVKCMIKLQELEFPEKLIVNSVMLTDRFVWQNSNPSDFYQYLGVRSTKTTSSTQSATKRTITHLFNATNENSNFKSILKELVKFLDFEEVFKINYSTKLNKLFFSGELKVEDFVKYYEEWWDEKFTFSNRKKENPIWSVPYYNKYFKGNFDAVQTIVNYLNRISKEENRLEHKQNSSSKIISIDLFDINFSDEDLKMIIQLENLDIVNVEGIKIKKNSSNLSISEISSGEYHLLISMIGIFSSISQNSLVLMDEPEISLHPNWQMRYVSFLKTIFEKFSSCQFILTTHSHFLVSDLEGKSSSVTALNRNVLNHQIEATLLKANTFGWSAEEVLLKVFKVATSRNYYVAEKLATLLEFIASEESNNNSIQNKFFELGLDQVNGLSEEDPLKTVFDTIISEYVSNRS